MQQRAVASSALTHLKRLSIQKNSGARSIVIIYQSKSSDLKQAYDLRKNKDTANETEMCSIQLINKFNPVQFMFVPILPTFLLTPLYVSK